MIERFLFVFIFFLICGFDVGPNRFTAVNPGDILDVQVSEDAPKDLKELKDKRLGDKIYVLDFDNDNRLLKVIITKPTEKKETDQSAVAANYINMQFNEANSATIPEYFSLKSGETYGAKDYYFYIISFICLIVLILLVVFLYPKFSIHLKNKKRKKILAEKIIMASTRSDYEELYQQRKELEKVLMLDAGVVDDFEGVMNAYQYRKDWSEEDLLKINKSIEKIKQSVRT